MGKQLSLTPTLVTIQDYLYIFKHIMHSKKALDQVSEHLSDSEGASLNFRDFLDVLIKIACLSKFKLGGLETSEEDHMMNDSPPKGKTIKEQHASLDKDFDVAEMTALTIEILLQTIFAVKPEILAVSINLSK